MRKNLGGEFEFTLHGWRITAAEGLPNRVGESVWTVTLPHQCGPWAIAGDEDATSDGVPKAEAERLLATFIAEAQAALDELRTLPNEIDDGPYDN